VIVGASCGPGALHKLTFVSEGGSGAEPCRLPGGRGGAHVGSVVSVRCCPVGSLGLATAIGALIADTTGCAVVPLCSSANAMFAR